MGEWFERVALGSLPSRAARRFGTREALVFEGRRWTFEDFDRDVDRAARGLLAAGVEVVVLFGSRARGTARPKSDWDVAV